MHFEKLKKLFTDPSKFFKDVSKEKGYWTVLKLYVIVYLTALVIQILASIPMNYGTPIFAYTVWTGLLVGIVGAFVTPFIGSFFTHLGVLIFGGRKGFFNTFKALTYGTLVVVVYGVLSSIVTLLLFLLKVEGKPFSVALTAIISIAGVVHMLFTSSMGVSMYHSISRWRAFLGIVLIPLILFIILIFAFVGLALISPALV